MGKLPLEGVRVVEFAHMVMGPSCGLVLVTSSDRSGRSRLEN